MSPRNAVLSVTLLLMIAVAIVTVIVLSGSRTTNQEAGKTSPIPAGMVEVKGVGTETNPSDSDTDQDGLKDWEETLWKTDPYNPDTDGDGAPDGLEIKLGRNPLVAGPNDEIIIERVNKLGDKIPPSTIVIKQSGTSAIQVAPTSKDSKELPAVDESASLKSTLRAYGNSLGAIIKRHRKSAAEETAILNGTIGTTTAETDTAIRNLSERYLAVSTDMNKIKAPEEAAGIHSKLAAAYDGYAAAAEGLANGGEHIAGDAFNLYSKQALALGQALLETSRFFAEEGVVFAANEDGYVFSLPH